MSDSIWSQIQQSAIGPRWKSCYLSSWRTSHWVTVQNMIHFLVLDRAWLRKPYYMDGVKKLKLHKQNGLDKEEARSKKMQSWDLWLHVDFNIIWGKREKKASGRTDYYLTDRWQPKVLFLKTVEDRQRKKVLLENLDNRRNCQKDEGQLNHFLPFSFPWLTELLMNSWHTF